MLCQKPKGENPILTDYLGCIEVHQINGFIWYKDYAILTWASTFTCWTSEISLKSYRLVIMRFGRNCNP